MGLIVARSIKIRNVSNRRAVAAEPASRRRDEVLESAIREATWAELMDHGYSGVTFEGVARRAKTGKPVLYRRYRSRAQMVTDALPILRAPAIGATSSLTLRDDILAIIEPLVEGWHHIGIDTYRSLIADADDAELQAFQTKVAEWADRTIYAALDNARERREIGPAELPYRVATSILALIRNEAFFARNPIDSSTLVELVDSVYLPAIQAAARA